MLSLLPWALRLIPGGLTSPWTKPAPPSRSPTMKDAMKHCLDSSYRGCASGCLPSFPSAGLEGYLGQTLSSCFVAIVAQPLSPFHLCVAPWTAAGQASLSFPIPGAPPLELTAYCTANVQANLSTVRVQNHDVKFTNG